MNLLKFAFSILSLGGLLSIDWDFGQCTCDQSISKESTASKKVLINLNKSPHKFEICNKCLKHYANKLTEISLRKLGSWLFSYNEINFEGFGEVNIVKEEKSQKEFWLKVDWTNYVLNAPQYKKRPN